MAFDFNSGGDQGPTVALRDSLAALAQQSQDTTTSLDQCRSTLFGVQDTSLFFNRSLRGVQAPFQGVADTTVAFGTAVDRCAQRLRTSVDTLNGLQLGPRSTAADSGGSKTSSTTQIQADSVTVTGPVTTQANGEKNGGLIPVLRGIGDVIQVAGSASEIAMAVREFRGRGAASPIVTQVLGDRTAQMVVDKMLVNQAIIAGGLGMMGGRPPGDSIYPDFDVVHQPPAPGPNTSAGDGEPPSRKTRQKESGPRQQTPNPPRSESNPKQRPGKPQMGRNGHRRQGKLKKLGIAGLLVGGLMTANALMPDTAFAQSSTPGGDTGGEGGGLGMGALALGGLAVAGGGAAALAMRRRRQDSGTAGGAIANMAAGAMDMAGNLGGGARRAGGGMMNRMGGMMAGRGGRMLGMAAKGAKMLSPVGLTMMAGGYASTAVADSMAARGVEMPEPGAMASTASAFTGFDPRLIQMGIDYLGTVPGLLATAWSGITATVSGWGESFRGFMQSVVDAAKLAWNNLVQYCTVTLPGYLLTAWQAVIGAVSTLRGMLEAAVQGVVNVVKAVFNGLVEYYTVFLPGMFMQGVDLIRDVFNGLISFFTDTIGGGLSAFMERVTAFKDGFVQAATEVAAQVVERLGGLGTFFTETLPQKLTDFLGVLAGWRDEFFGFASQVATGFVDKLKAIPEYFLTTLPDMLRNGARGVINALTEGLLEAAGQIPRVGSQIAGRLADYLMGNSPPKEGPLKTIATGAGNVIRAWARGLTAARGAVAGAATGLARTAAGTLNGKPDAAGQPSPALAAASMIPLLPGIPGAALAAGMAARTMAQGGTTGTPPKAPGEDDKKPGMLGQALDMAKEKFMGLASSLSPLSMVATFLDGVFQSLAPVIEALKEPLKIVGEIFGAALAPILRALFPVFKIVAIAATWVGQIFFTIAGGILRAVGALIKGLGKAIDKIPGLGDFGLKKAGQGLLDLGNGFRESASAMAEGRERIANLELSEPADGASQMAESATQASEALSNVPSGFKIAVARMTAAQAVPVKAPATAGLPGALATGGATQDNSVTVGAITINGTSKNAKELWLEIKDEMRRESLRQNGTTAGYAFA